MRPKDGLLGRDPLHLVDDKPAALVQLRRPRQRNFPRFLQGSEQQPRVDQIGPASRER